MHRIDRSKLETTGYRPQCRIKQPGHMLCVCVSTAVKCDAIWSALCELLTYHLRQQVQWSAPVAFLERRNAPPPSRPMSRCFMMRRLELSSRDFSRASLSRRPFQAIDMARLGGTAPSAAEESVRGTLRAKVGSTMAIPHGWALLSS